MMAADRFYMNGYLWKIRFVEPDDQELVDRTGELKVATTDPKTLTVNLSNELRGDFLMTVFIHELGHCALFSFGFLDKIRKMVYPDYRIEMEEFICNFLSDFSLQIFKIAYSKMGYNAWKQIPEEFNKKFA